MTANDFIGIGLCAAFLTAFYISAYTWRAPWHQVLRASGVSLSCFLLEIILLGVLGWHFGESLPNQ